ncbi:MAG: PIN domain-containing protein [Pyrinomonadaceae bacterium]|nr:PIN domain-containing protein [Pyrinomonadaceae bacterium]
MIKNVCLLDTGFLFAFLNESDKYHESVSSILETLNDTIILPVPVITEVAYLVQRDLGIIAMSNFIESLSETDFILETPIAEDYKRAAEIIRKYDDANIDFVDSMIVAIAERLNVTKILTVDTRHFRIFRPSHCETFEILP